MTHEILKVENHGKNPFNLTHLEAIQEMGYPLLQSRITKMKGVKEVTHAQFVKWGGK